MDYRGWTIYNESTDRPMWVGYQHGITVRNTTLEGVKLVIDNHIEDLKAWYKRGLG